MSDFRCGRTDQFVLKEKARLASRPIPQFVLGENSDRFVNCWQHAQTSESSKGRPVALQSYKPLRVRYGRE